MKPFRDKNNFSGNYSFSYCSSGYRWAGCAAPRRNSAGLGVDLGPGHPVTDVAATYFRRLASRPDMFTVPGAEALSEPSIELMRAVHHHPPQRRRTRQGFTESDTAAADPGVRPRTSARPASRRGPSRRRASHFRASPLQHSRRQRNHPGRLDPKTAPRTLPQRHRRLGLSRHPDRIDRTRMGIHRSLKLYPHIQKRLRHVATRVATPINTRRSEPTGEFINQ